jgi:hypothetical protein
MIDENAVIAEIADLLDAITDVSVVYQGIPNAPTEFPYISIRPSAWSEDYADLRDTEIEENFIVSVYQDLSDDTLAAQTLIRSIVKQIHQILSDETNVDLGGTVDFTTLTSGSYQFDQTNSSIYFCDITYKVKKKFNRYS